MSTTPTTDATRPGWPIKLKLPSLRRGELWESLAIPELRDQAAALAARFTSL